MDQELYFKLEKQRPVDLARKLQLDAPACALLVPGQTVADYVVSLAQAELFPAAFSVLAHALPKREAVWWGCTAVRYADPPVQGSDAEAALAAAEAWVYRPTDENRQPIGAVAVKAGMNTSTGWAAMAAFWSSGSLTPPDSPAVPPNEDLTGKAVAGATTLAAIQRGAQSASGFSIAFIRMALDIARGGDGRHVPE